jgi:hypothetical protein
LFKEASDIIHASTNNKTAISEGLTPSWSLASSQTPAKLTKIMPGHERSNLEHVTSLSNCNVAIINEKAIPAH